MDAEKYKAKGFTIIAHKGANSEEVFCNMWSQDGVYAISFAGHGSRFGFIADKDSGFAIAPNSVHPPYRLSAVRAYSCLSALDLPGDSILSDGTIPTYSWRDHVSSSGTFIGYSGKVNWVNQFWQRTTINERLDGEK